MKSSGLWTITIVVAACMCTCWGPALMADPVNLGSDAAQVEIAKAQLLHQEPDKAGLSLEESQARAEKEKLLADKGELPPAEPEAETILPLDESLPGAPRDGEPRAACVGDKDINGAGSSAFSYLFNAYWASRRVTSIYTASEFSCDTGGEISGIRFYVSTLPTAGYPFTNFQIALRHTTASNYTSPYCFSTDGWTVVYTSASQAITSTGWNTFTFSTPFVYNGADSLEVDVSWGKNPSDSGNTGSIWGYTASPTPRTIYGYTDSVTALPPTWTCAVSGLYIYSSTTTPRCQFVFPPATTGACCVNNTCVATDTESQCQALQGTWYGGQDCASFFCPPRNDDCAAVTPVALVPNTPVTFTGDTRGATADPGTCSFSTPQVWHAITLDGSCSSWDVTLDYCSTVGFSNAYLNWANGCPCTGLTAAGTADTTTCGDGNFTIRWTGLAPGTYYYPVLSSQTQAWGPYTIHVVARCGYCSSTATSTADENIQDFVLSGIEGGIDHHNPTAGWCDMYNAFTGESATLQAGATYSFSLTIGDCEGASCYSKRASIFVDWNRNFDFADAGEIVWTSGQLTNSPCPTMTVTGNIIVPVGAAVGATRLRVVVVETSSADPAACGSYTWGATEDYTVQIIPAPPEGACCHNDGGNIVCTAPVTLAACQAMSGVYKGDGSGCDPVNPCFGACCHPDGTCTMEFAANCVAPGIYHGDGVACESVNCPQPGGCCTPDGYCYMSSVVGGDCAPGDHYRGDNTNCDSACPPPNDECVNAVPIGEVADFAFDTSGATTSGIGTHNIYNDIWYCYTATCNGQVIVDLCGPDTWDTKIAVWEGCACPPVVELAYNDDSGPGCSGVRSSVEFVATAGSSYLIQVGAYSSSGRGPGDLSVTCLVPPANDTCATATVIPWMPFSDAVDARGASDDVGPSCGTGATRYGVWYTYTPAADCALVVSETSSNDVVISVHTGTDCNSIWELACSGPDSMVVPGLVGGTQYWILIGMYSATAAPSGLYTVDFDCVVPPSNDTCDTATVIPGLPFSDSPAAQGANPDFALTCSPNPATNFGVWYTFTPTADCSATITETSSNDVNIAVFTGTNCSDLWEYACSTGDTATATGLTAGTQYWVLVGMGSATASPTGPYALTIDCVPPPPNDLCANATPVVEGEFDWYNSFGGTDGLPFSAACPGDAATDVKNDVWFLYTATCTDTATVTTCNAPVGGTNISDTVLAVYASGVCPPTDDLRIACDDDIDPPFTCTESSLRSTLEFPATAGTSYLIRVGSYNASNFGTGRLTITQPPCSGCALMGDLNADTSVDGLDVQGFVNCILGGGANCACGDYTGDGFVTESDIPAFVAALLAP